MRKLAWIGIALLAGCVTVGNKFDIERVDLLRAGTSTTFDAVRELGQPTTETTLGDGTKLLQWQFSQGTPVSGRGAVASILFDQHGTMLRVVSKTKIRL